MVLWEIALGTAYFLGLKRSYKLALKIQRRIISRNQPRLQQFVQRIVYSVIMLFLHAFYSIEFLPDSKRHSLTPVFFRNLLPISATRRTRVVFDIALKVHRNIQHRDLEVGRNLGDCILRWLHKIKPSAQIRGPPPHQEPNHGTGKANMNMPKQVTDTSSPKTPRSNQSPRNHDAGRHLFSSLTSTWPKSFPTTIAMMMQPPTATGNMARCRHLSIKGPDTSRLNCTRDQGVVRKDIMQWMVRN
ncbi:hypothetical protein CXB51_007688 [Gossypium anomalum]|uniref:Uncharacterized protein n=1 Tax=Gossypium anomalum TaxID=47600 RepID=A0A8J5YT94_9ROSI|nr:hypothetical protein CXB51_007688 [Gossypium anomalum]